MTFLGTIPASLHSNDTSSYDERDENYQSSEDEREYYCEVCDREFPSEECLQKHIGEHRVCGIDGCVFSAHPKLVEKHISMQHSTGLYHRMKNLSTPDDITKWITERKKRYPTKANIEHLKAEASEKRQRYEVIREKKSLTESKKVKSELKKPTRRKNRRRPFITPVSVKSNEPQLYKGIEAFAGTLTLWESTSDAESSLIEDSDNEMDVKYTKETSKAVKMEQIAGCEENNTFSLSLVADYGTDSDKDNEPEEVPFKKIKVDINNIESTPDVSSQNDRRNNNRSRSRNNNGRYKPKEFEKSGKTDDEQDRRRFQRTSNENRNTRGNKTNKIELLNKLLSRSIQHERNLISQCIKYIVDNNYFE